jgi:hypothetical protein
MKNKVTDELKKHFRPEFLNRVDDIIVFPQLTQDEIVADRRPGDCQARQAAARQGHGPGAHAGSQGAAGQEGLRSSATTR